MINQQRNEHSKAITILALHGDIMPVAGVQIVIHSHHVGQTDVHMRSHASNELLSLSSDGMFTHTRSLGCLILTPTHPDSSLAVVRGILQGATLRVS